jgi:hypothetical protein
MDQTGDPNGTEGERAVLENLARRLIELWIDQAGALAADPATAEASRRWRDAVAGPASAFWSQATEGFRHAATDPAAARRWFEEFAVWNPAAARPAPAGATSSTGGATLSELTRRLDELERRLAALEGAGDRSGGSDGAARKRKAERGSSAARSRKRAET